MRLNERKGLYTHVTKGLTLCAGCGRAVGIDTFTLADETGKIVRCPECAKAPLL